MKYLVIITAVLVLWTPNASTYAPTNSEIDNWIANLLIVESAKTEVDFGDYIISSSGILGDALTQGAFNLFDSYWPKPGYSWEAVRPPEFSKDFPMKVT